MNIYCTSNRSDLDKPETICQIEKLRKQTVEELERKRDSFGTVGPAREQHQKAVKKVYGTGF